MISRDEIKKALRTIANASNLAGEAVELQLNELTYLLYHNQVDIVNAVQESNLSTAVLLNSKIRSCMNVMYPIFRGRNARVNLAFISDTLINKNKFDVLYSSNTFKVYADSVVNITKNDPYNPVIQEVTGIISKENLYEAEIDVTTNNKYYIDVKINRTILSDLSEDILVYINDQLYPTTRNFYDHVQKAVPIKNLDAYIIGSDYYYAQDKEWKSVSTTYPGADSGMTEDEYQLLIKSLHTLGELDSTLMLPDLKYGDQGLDYIFVLTIPDYGIRLYKRGYFDAYSVVKVKAFKYTTLDEINDNEFSKIMIPGTKLVFTPEVPTLSKNTIVRKGSKLNGAIREVERDNAKSILYTANLYQRLQSTILSNSDVNVLFNEHFIERVSSSINWYLGDDDHSASESIYTNTNNGTVFIFYVPKVAGDVLSDEEVEEFKVKYASHFVTSKIIAVPGILCEINVTISLVKNNTLSAIPEVESILAEFANRLNDPSLFQRVEELPDGRLPDPTTNNLLNYKIISAMINKISSVEYIQDISYEYADPSFPDDLGRTLEVNVYESSIHPMIYNGIQYLPLTLKDRDIHSTTYDKTYKSILVPTYYKFNIANQQEVYKYAALS